MTRYGYVQEFSVNACDERPSLVEMTLFNKLKKYSTDAIMEIGSYKVASLFSKEGRTALALIPSHMFYCQSNMDTSYYGSTNSMFVATKSLPEIYAFFRDMTLNPQYFVETIVISNISLLIGRMLPNEVHFLIGSIINMAKNVYILNPTLAEYEQFFGYWGTIKELVEASVVQFDITGINVTLDENRTYFHITYTQVKRHMERALCDKIHGSRAPAATSSAPCYITQIFDSVTGREQSAVEFYDLDKFHFPATLFTVPLLLPKNFSLEFLFAVTLDAHSLEIISMAMLHMANPRLLELYGRSLDGILVFNDNTVSYIRALPSQCVVARGLHGSEGERRMSAARELTIYKDGSFFNKQSLVSSVGRDRQFERNWPLLWESVTDSGLRPATRPSILTFGASSLLLGSKLASLVPGATVVSVLPYSEQSPVYIQAIRTITASKIGNQIVLSAPFSLTGVKTLHELPDLFRYQFLSMDVFANIVGLGGSFMFHFGRILTMASVSFVELPDPVHLQRVVDIMNKSLDNDAKTTLTGLLKTALYLQNIKESDFEISLVTIPQPSSSDGSSYRWLKINIHAMSRRVLVDCANTKMYLKIAEGRVDLQETTDTAEEPRIFLRPLQAVSLQFFLSIGLTIPVQKRLFLDYVSIPIHTDMCPVHLAIFSGVLRYAAVVPPVEGEGIDLEGEDVTGEGCVLRQLSGELISDSFSLLEYGSGTGLLSVKLAEKFKSSTIVSIEEDEKKTAQHWEKIRNKTDNNAICNQEPSLSFVKKLSNSPEFFRYQVFFYFYYYYYY